MMNKADSNEQIDSNNAQRKADVLRAKDIIPHSTDDTSGGLPGTVGKKEKAKIPKFNLAEQIMAEQRKAAAIRRKGPGKITEVPRGESKVEPVGHTIGKPIEASAEQRRIIAEIVARDIERLYGGGR